MRTYQVKRRPKRRTPSRRGGHVIVFVALLLVVILAMVAFAIDVGYIVHVDTELQRTADACALAAVRELPDRSQATDVAKAVATENYGTAGPDLKASDIQFGRWDADTATFSPSDSQANAVRVTVRRSATGENPLQLFFAPVIGHSTADVRASAIAAYDTRTCGPLVGIDWVSVPGDPTTDSYRSSEGSYASQAPRENGSLCSDGPIALEGSPIVKGDANPGRGYQTTIEGSGIVTGSTSPRLRPLNMPPVDTSAISVNNDNDELPYIQKGNNLVSPVDADRNFLIDGGKTYTVPPGRYYFNDFTLTGQSELYFEGKTTIYLTGNLDTSGGRVFNATQIPNNVRIFMTGGTALVTASVDFYGVVYAPNTDVELAGGGEFFGTAVGRTLTLTGNGDIHYDEDLDVQDEVDLPKRVAMVK